MNSNLVVVAALLLIGCGGDREAGRRARAGSADRAAAAKGSTPAAEPGPRDICGYITEAEASDALDQPTKFRARDAAAQGGHCTLDPVSGDVFHGMSVDFRVTRGSTATYDFLKAQKAAESVGGLGDGAFWLPAGANRGNLAAVKGTDAVSVTISDLSGKGDLKDRARALAKRILGNL